MLVFEPNPARRPVIISGASSGIGAATALTLYELGFPAALAARRVVTKAEATLGPTEIVASGAGDIDFVAGSSTTYGARNAAVFRPWTD